MDVEGCAGPGKRRQLGGDHDCGDIFQFDVIDIVRIDGHPVADDHVVDRLQGEPRFFHVVTGAVKAGHETVAEQLIVSHPLEGGDILDPHCLA